MKYKNMRTPEKYRLAQSIQKRLKQDKKYLTKLEIQDLCGKYNCSESTIHRVKRTVNFFDSDDEDSFNLSTNLHQRGRNSELTDNLRTAIAEELQRSADIRKYLPLRDLALRLAQRGFNRSISTLWDYLDQMGGDTKILAVKPSLTDVQRDNRVIFVLDMRDKRQGLNHTPYFKSQLNVVHIDESWFWLQLEGERIRILPDTIIPECDTTRHKSHIVKVMFLTAIARPQEDPDGNWFEGKIGIWPCVVEELTKRDSKNRPAGIPEYKPRSLHSKFYSELILGPGGVLETVKQKLHWHKESGLILQHDGATPHNGGGNADAFAAAGKVDGWNIEFVTQPAQSPDLNLLDLSFFHALKCQSNKLKLESKNIEGLINRVKEAYNNYPWDKIDHMWAHLFTAYNAILRDIGGNQYGSAHDNLRTKGKGRKSIVDLKIDLEAYNNAVNYINEKNSA